MSMIYVPEWGASSRNARQIKPYWLGRGLKALYVLTPEAWQINQVTGKQTGTFQTGSVIAYGGDYIGTSGFSHIPKLPLNGFTKFPGTIIVGWQHISGAIDWSLFSQSSGDWSGMYGDSAGGHTTMTNSFDGVLLPTSQRPDFPIYAFTSWGANNFRGCVNGGPISVDSSCNAVTYTDITTAYLGGSFHTGTLDNLAAANFKVFAAFANPLSDTEMRVLTADWKDELFIRHRTNYFFSTGGGAAQALSGSAAAVAAATGALTQAVPIAGAALAAATATGAMSLSLPLSADVGAVANAAGGLSLTIPLSASAVAQALASAGIALGVPMGGSGTAEALAVADISLNVTLAGDAISEASASAGLTVTSASSLTGDAAAQAAASGAISLDVPLAGAALTISNADGSLTQIVPLTGSAASASLATGGLDLGISLSGSALAQALAAADLTAESGGAALGGGATAIAAATGTMTLRINLAGDAIAHATAGGALTGAGLLTVTPMYLIREAARDWTVDESSREWRIAS